MKNRRPHPQTAEALAELGPSSMADIDLLHLPPSDGQVENLLRLERLLQRAQGFALAFARVNLPVQRDILARELVRRAEQTGVRVVEVTLREAVTDVLAVLQRHLRRSYVPSTKPAAAQRLQAVADKPRLAVFVYGLEHSLSSSEKFHPVLSVLNYKRENFRNQMPGPLVFWLPEYALQLLIEGAPDFWAWRSSMVEFTPPPAALDAARSMLVSGVTANTFLNLSLHEKERRIELVTNLLAEYEAHEAANSAEIARIRMDLLQQLWMLCYSIGNNERALGFLRRLARLADHHAHKGWAAAAALGLGFVYQARGNYNGALAEYEKSLQIAKELGARTAQASTWNLIGHLFYLLDDFSAALAAYEESLRIKKESGEGDGGANAVHQLGIIHQARGDYGASMVEFDKALKIFDRLGDRPGVASSLHQIGNLNYLRENYSAALVQHEQSLKIKEELGDRDGVAISLYQIGMILQARGDYDAALVKYEKSLEIEEELGNRAGVASSLHQIGIIHQKRGDIGKALASYEKSLKINEDLGNYSDIARSGGQLGKLMIGLQRYADALQLLLPALSILSETQSPNARIVFSLLKTLRQQWGVEKFDRAWQEQTGQEVPEELK